MSRVALLEQLQAFTRDAIGDIIMPTKLQERDTEQGYRSADVYLMRLPDSKAAQKKAPYIIHQFLTGKDAQMPGEREISSATVRSIFCVYNDDEQEGALMLMNLMERLRIAMLKQSIIGKRFQLDLSVGLEALAYPEDTAPFFAGEMVSTWKLPTVEREV